MFIDANELKEILFEHGYSAGTFDAEQQHTGTDFQITIRIQVAQYMARYDAWSQGYLAGYDKRSSELSASTAAHGVAGE